MPKSRTALRIKQKRSKPWHIMRAVKLDKQRPVKNGYCYSGLEIFYMEVEIVTFKFVEMKT